MCAVKLAEEAFDASALDWSHVAANPDVAALALDGPASLVAKGGVASAIRSLAKLRAPTSAMPTSPFLGVETTLSVLKPRSLNSLCPYLARGARGVSLSRLSASADPMVSAKSAYLPKRLSRAWALAPRSRKPILVQASLPIKVYPLLRSASLLDIAIGARFMDFKPSATKEGQEVTEVRHVQALNPCLSFSNASLMLKADPRVRLQPQVKVVVYGCLA